MLVLIHSCDVEREKALVKMVDCEDDVGCPALIYSI